MYRRTRPEWSSAIIREQPVSEAVAGQARIDAHQSSGRDFLDAPWPTAYTAFYGDNMCNVDYFCNVAESLHRTPVNPDRALKYHLATSVLDHSKREVMKRCISLALHCDELFLFTSPFTMPEGVIAELMAFIMAKPDAPVRILGSHGRSDFQDGESLSLLKYVDTTSMLELMPLVEACVADPIPVVYLSFDSQQTKYMDFASEYVLRDGKIPVSTDAMLGHTYNRFTGVSQAELHSFRSIFGSTALLHLADELCVVGPPENRAGTLRPAWHSSVWNVISDEPIRYADWGDFGIRKFVPGRRSEWSLTSAEGRLGI